MAVRVKYMFNRLAGHTIIFFLSERNFFIPSQGLLETSDFFCSTIILTALTLHYHHKTVIHLNEDSQGIKNKKN